MLVSDGCKLPTDSPEQKISSKDYPYMRPGLETMPWGMIETGVIDPFGNLIRFCQRVEQPATA